MWDVRYRPLKFVDVLGQEGSVRLLKSRLKNGTALDTSYILSGGHGQGKTSLARILARAILCENLSKDDPEPCNECDNCTTILDDTSTAFTEMDAASRGTIDNIRAIVDDLPFAVFGAVKRIYLFDEAHRMSREAQDVLLKPLEDKKLVGIFCTTEPERIRGTIRSRCEQYAIRKVAREDILVRAKKVLSAEGVEHEDDAVLTVIDYSGGHVRDILNRLEMVSQMGAVNIENVRAYLKLSVISTYYEVLLALDDPAKAVSLVEQACEQVAAEEVASGLAEAAMNSYRLAYGMHTDFTSLDKSLAQKVHARFGAETIRLAEYFLRSRYVTQVSLACDILSWAQAAKHLPVFPVAYAPQPGMTQPPPAPTFQPPVAAPAPSVTSGPPVAAPQAGAQEKPTSVPGNGKSHDPALRFDGVGPWGSSDSEAHTVLDPLVVPEKTPRRRDTIAAPKLALKNVLEDESKSLGPEEWRRVFEKLWGMLSGGGHE